MANAIKVRQTEVPRKPGELARFKVVQGPDLGCTFVVTGPSVSVGRGVENDLILADPKASRKHADLVYSGGGWSFKDSGSANGVLFKGKMVRQGSLRMGDTLTIGATTLEFMTSDQATQMLMAPARTAEQLEGDRLAIEARKKSLRGQAPNPLSSGAPQAGGNKRLVLYGGLGLMLLLLFLGGQQKDDSTGSRKKGAGKASNTQVLRDIASLSPLEDDAANRQVNQFFSLGYREYRERNYVRAKEHFETLLQMMPQNAKAIRYVILCDEGMVDAVEKYLLSGERSLQIGRFHEADGHLRSAVRLIAKVQLSNYIDPETKKKLEGRRLSAEERLKELQNKRGEASSSKTAKGREESGEGR
jgi:pSer/pThr/pTyr-binding forkhead associated (FHA) protein